MDIEANKGRFGTEKLSSRMFLLSMTFQKILDTLFVRREEGFCHLLEISQLMLSSIDL